ncbi:hypothetical protein ACE198_05015 [Neobacillus sp. KR4-4]|uniref:hypothetical protein n=1 Tax=Neobacillus sp. KR4-4 TaxID=3344872 RepID=UPI0035CB0F48
MKKLIDGIVIFIRQCLLFIKPSIKGIKKYYIVIGNVLIDTLLAIKLNFSIKGLFIKTALFYMFNVFVYYSFIRSTLALIIIVFSIYLYTFFYGDPPEKLTLSPSVVDKLTEIKENLGFNGINDYVINNAISGISASLAIIVSIVSAFYVFTHREQKSISPSASIKNGKNYLVAIFIISFVLTLLFGHTLSSNYESLIADLPAKTLDITNLLHKRVILFVTSVLCSIYLFVKLIRYLLASMSINEMLIDSINETQRNIILITKFYKSSRFQRLLNGLYQEAHYNIESVYQNLKYVSENNMNQEFEDSILKFEEVIKVFGSDNTSLKNVSPYLLNRDNNQYINLYSSLLRNTLSLINYLYKNQHYNKGRRITQLYFSLYTNEEETLKKFFIISLKEFLDSIDINSNRQMDDFLSGLNSIPLQEVLIIYKKLLMILISNNNIKSLTKVVYIFKDRIQSFRTLQTQGKKDALAPRVVIDIKNFVVIILLQCLIRSIEISHYGSTGFLIKYLITNFETGLINKCFISLKKNPKFFTKIFDANTNVVASYLDEIDTRESNEETFDYCGKKLLILLFGQQQFVKKNKLWFIKENVECQEIRLREEFANCTYPAYLYNKLISASKNYGLLFFEDKEVMERIRNEIGVSEKEVLVSK